MQKSYYNLSDNERNVLFYKSGKIKTPLIEKTRITYADYIASGQPSPIIESYLAKKVYPYYSNTHSNANNGIMMKNMIASVKNQIRKDLNIQSDYQILFPSNGTTASINHLVNLIEYQNYEKVIIYISLYEHYSNQLPFVELQKLNKNIKVKIIPFTSNTDNSGIIDLNWLNQSISKDYNKLNNNLKKTLIICSISACSNITGIINPLNDIRKLLDQYPNSDKFHKYFFADYACSAPYVKIDGSILDGLSFSCHKFLGGISTPGILIAKSCLFTKGEPFIKGGGCVKKCNSTQVIYEDDIEKKESAGTPNIIGIIKIGKILELKNHYQNIIDTNEEILFNLIKKNINYFESKYSTFKSVLYNDNVKHLPIFSFHLINLHYNLIVVLLNDLFGIQSRGGIGCCGLLAEHIETNYGYRGWCRVSFNWSMDMQTVLNIFKAIEFVIKNGESYKSKYKYLEGQNLYEFIQ